MFIDADTHIDETTATWDYWPKSMIDMKPAEMEFVNGQAPGYTSRPKRAPSKGWFIDGRIFNRRVRSDEFSATTIGTRELYDIPGRLADMDAMGVETQIIYPSTLLEEVTRRPEIEIAVCESYNRWLEDRCSESNGRLRWNAILPMRSIPHALSEMRHAKEAGAIGIFKRAMETDNRRAGDSYFDPVYELAQELGMPICMHVSTFYTGMTPTFSKTEQQVRREFLVMDAFASIALSGTAKKFSDLRFGFVESASAWLPYLLWFVQIEKSTLASQERGEAVAETYNTLLEDQRLFVTCESTEDLQYVIAKAGDNNLMVGSDYSHVDRSARGSAHQEIVDYAGLPEESIRKLTETNARRFYDL